MTARADSTSGSSGMVLYASEVARTAADRTADSRRVPAAMRRDVRMLGELLGAVIRESDGDDLLADVEDLRCRVIAARHADPGDGDEAGIFEQDADDDIAALIASWPAERAEAVARAFTVYFHLAKLAEEPQRVRILRERDTGAEPIRESLGAAMTSLARPLSPGQRDLLLSRLEVHPVLTAHPTEARRRAVTEALRRVSALLTSLDDGRLGASDRAEIRRRLREGIDLLWRTSALRAVAMQPLDEVRAAMTAFDETLFRVVPALYRSLDRALSGPASGRVASAAPPFIRYGSWIRADREGNPFVTAGSKKQPARQGRPASPTAARPSSSPTCAWCSGSWRARAPSGRHTASCSS